ncbi:hypothetical protein JCM24511_09442 [Saitozyma sp. JCM 24511]|nr:hypothetical protein JCM24511_09442 [Saitozyma sp. JCM 24511]
MSSSEQSVPLDNASEDRTYSCVRLPEGDSREWTMGEDVAEESQRYTITEGLPISDTSEHSDGADVVSASRVESTAHGVTHKEQHRTLAEIIALRRLKEYLDRLPTIESVLEWYEARSEVQRVIYFDHLAHLLEYGEYLTTVYETLEEREAEDGCVGEEPIDDQLGGEAGGGSRIKALALMRALMDSDRTGMDEEERRRREESAREGALEFMLSWRSRLGGGTGLAEKEHAESAKK